VPSLIDFGLLVLGKKIKKNFRAFSLFRYYLPLQRGYPLLLNKLESPLPKDALCQVWLKLAQKKIFKNIQCFFTLSLLSPL
jgi:hypothetical protein